MGDLFLLFLDKKLFLVRWYFVIRNVHVIIVFSYCSLPVFLCSPVCQGNLALWHLYLEKLCPPPPPWPKVPILGTTSTWCIQWSCTFTWDLIGKRLRSFWIKLELFVHLWSKVDVHPNTMQWGPISSEFLFVPVHFCVTYSVYAYFDRGWIDLVYIFTWCETFKKIIKL